MGAQRRLWTTKAQTVFGDLELLQERLRLADVVRSWVHALHAVPPLTAQRGGGR